MKNPINTFFLRSQMIHSMPVLVGFYSIVMTLIPHSSGAHYYFVNSPACSLKNKNNFMQKLRNLLRSSVYLLSLDYI
jgi:hypothetical protein